MRIPNVKINRKSIVSFLPVGERLLYDKPRIRNVTAFESPHMLDPDARALLDLIVEKQIAPVHTLNPVQARAAYVARRYATQRDPTPVASVRDEMLSYTEPSGARIDIPIRTYRPAQSDATPAPALVYFHGGGWVIGDLDTHDGVCRDLADQSGYVVISVDYRLAPEAPFPAAVNDCIAAFGWVAEQAHELGINPEKIAVGGDSAGGCLAAVVSLHLRDARRVAATVPVPCFQLLIYPVTDKRAVAPSHQINGQGYLLTTESMHYFRGHYLPNPADWLDWRASPLLASDHSDLPPALVLTAGYDPLRDEGRQYADALSAAGTPCQYVCFERQIHGFLPMNKAIGEADTALAMCARALKSAVL
jgi:acetyl esterase